MLLSNHCNGYIMYFYSWDSDTNNLDLCSDESQADEEICIRRKIAKRIKRNILLFHRGFRVGRGYHKKLKINC